MTSWLRRWAQSRRSAKSSGGQRDRGSVSVFFALCTVAILMMMGLIVDGGGALNAADNATSIAQEAARTAGQQIDPAQAVAGTAITIDPDAAVGAAQDYLDAAGVQGDVQVTNGGQSLSITVHDTYSTLFAQFVGTSTINVTGTATAHLMTQAGG